MSRMIANDFDRLLAYIKQYSISTEIQNKSLETELKKGHKVYLCLLSLWYSVECLHRESQMSLCDKSISDVLTMNYMEEAISDIGSAFSCCIHGNYKPAFMLLRSSIENYLRFISCEFNHEAKTTTVINNLFEIAKETPVFENQNRDNFNQLRQVYGELCAYTHTASLNHMTRIHAISHFPRFDREKLVEWNQKALVISNIILHSTLLSNRKIYTNAHYKIKEILEEMLPKTLCRKLNGVDHVYPMPPSLPATTETPV
ncbi:hypothetical protein [Aeromonas salmonicida]|uniref:hypothetical protein n=1 Tax=Aeromonas salmonicida TaxID=645 RepID=UPI00259D3531|nr:hypothetical protein [Aeromonas salmonicida]MDM5114286.1 hypothetical protein [Aeromonas salmonicida]